MAAKNKALLLVNFHRKFQQCHPYYYHSRVGPGGATAGAFLGTNLALGDFEEIHVTSIFVNAFVYVFIPKRIKRNVATKETIWYVSDDFERWFAVYGLEIATL